MSNEKLNPQTTLQAISAFLSYHDKEDYDGVFVVARQRDENFQVFCGGTAGDPDYADDWRAVQFLAESVFEDIASWGEPEKPSLQLIDGGHKAAPLPDPAADMRQEFAKSLDGKFADMIEKTRHIHPRPNDQGKMVTIHHPSIPSPLSAFDDPKQTAVVLPDEPTPPSLHGIPFEPWKSVSRSLAEWIHVEGQAKLDEPPMKLATGKKAAAGVVIVEPDGRYWVVAPTNAFGGYKATFPKGTIEPGMGPQATAIKEAYEEAGLQVEITRYIGDFERTTSVTRYYFARRVGGTPAAMGWESQAVMLAPQDQLLKVLNHAKDHELLKAIKLAVQAGPQTIVQVGGEGGSIKLTGIQTGGA